MEKISEYSKIARSIVGDVYKRYTRPTEKVKHILALDDVNKNYILISDGWLGANRFYGILIHIEVKGDSKIWVHDDNTDLVIVDWLLEKGIPKHDIVIGWHDPISRPDTEFAVG